MEKRFCFRCKTEVEIEEESAIDSPYYCPECDENMYTFETLTIEEFQKNKGILILQK